MSRLPSYDELPRAKGKVGSAWGVFGAGDSLGRIALQTPERIAAAARLVRRGDVFSLNAPLNAIEPAFFGRGVPRHTMIRTRFGGADAVIDNRYPQASSQWDSLAHAAFEPGIFYNGATYDDIVAGRNTIDHWARRGIAGRAVLLDAARTYADAGRAFDPGSAHAITVADLELARERSHITFEPGDILLLHTGYHEWYGRQEAAAKAALPANIVAVGLEHTEAMARYLWDTQISAIATDNPGVEVFPCDRSPEAWPFGFLHNTLIAQFGLALGEFWWLHDLAEDCARDGVYEMFFTSAPLNVPSGIGSPANALAIK